MVFKNNITNNMDELSASMLTEVVEMIGACSNDLMVVAEVIAQVTCSPKTDPVVKLV